MRDHTEEIKATLNRTNSVRNPLNEKDVTIPGVDPASEKGGGQISRVPLPVPYCDKAEKDTPG